MTISLEKRTESAIVSLTKVLQDAADRGEDLGELTAQIILVIDYSESMEWPENRFYTKGEVQELSERVLALSLSGLDDDGNIQIFPFSSTAYEHFEVNETNYQGCIEKWRYPDKGLFGKGKPRNMGGTNYSAVIQKIIQVTTDAGMLQPGKPPVLVAFQTDGKTSNFEQVKADLTAAAHLPIFWQFIGLGNDTTFLSILDTLPDRLVDNVGFFGVTSIAAMPDEEFYDKLTNEAFSKWLPEVRSRGIVTV